MTVQQLLDATDSRELGEWMAYHTHIEPIGEVRNDLRAGIIASTIANVNRGKNKQAFTPAEFMPYHEKPKQTEEQMRATFLGAFKNIGET